ncbi:Thioredoxin-like protein 1 [Coelomomyces lativittatus]|nr:Thioredoxin-like protein 1 [Coelomomyces lativittatus]
MKGANANELENLVLLHGSEIPTVSSSGPKPLYIPTGYSDISIHLNLTQADCLNQKQNKSIQNLLREKGILESDVDEQLLITIAFNQAVKLHSIKFFQEEFETAPKRIKLFVNRTSMGFDEADSIEPVQTLDLTKNDFEETQATVLRFVKFQSVNILTIFVENNQSNGEITQLRGLKFIGGVVAEPTKTNPS